MKIREAKVVWEVREDGPAIRLDQAHLVVDYMKGAFDTNPEQESFWIIALNRKNYAKGRYMVTLGTAVSCLAPTMEIFRFLCLQSATAFICVHNHPSGDPAPSSADLQITRNLKEAGKIMNIEILDHIIIGEKEIDPNHNGFYSLRNGGYI